ncbi:hypothetical protein JIN77_14105 [Verrucomicrobiaceae bacterium R5-34]|nr:hypothetical protein [Verrucomicrobiaceae bacterium R5-34]
MHPPLSHSIQALCQGRRALLQEWLMEKPLSSLAFSIPAVVLGCGLYGFTLGLWQGGRMGCYVAVKFPLVIFATLLVNGVLNGMLALVLGSGISFRQSVQFLLAGFALMAVILGSLSPVTCFMALQAPMPEHPGAKQWHSALLLIHTLVIAYAGIIAHRSLLGQLRDFASSPKLGTRTFFAWLAGNLFVGAQISWIMRPFFGSPGLAVQFLRDDPMEGSFYETLWRAFLRLLEF